MNEDDFPDVTYPDEPAIPSYATDGPYDYGNPLEDYA